MACAVVLPPLLLFFVVLSGSTALTEQHAAGVDDINYSVVLTSSWLNPKAVCSRLSTYTLSLS